MNRDAGARAFQVPAFAKVNLALEVLGRRPDGFHEIRTVFQSIDLHDTLAFEPAPGLELDCLGLPGLAPEQNLVWKAALELARAAGRAPDARITLHKRIPAGAGLGGGSSDAAATLLGLRRLWASPVPDAMLREVAAGLGSDVPYFLSGGTALGIGRGEEIYPLPDLPEAHLVVVYPGVHISTAEAYRSLAPLLTSPRSAHRIMSFCGRLEEGLACLAGIFNDFETSILPAQSEIREARELLAGLGAEPPLLSGSGSSVFGFFVNEESARAALGAETPAAWRVFPAKTLSRKEYLRRILG